ncbi:hypothetical protein M8542_09145 [Amycolatopsis sp. OK19-0408]|uniref:Uncharacterized protein n=1 Tax=Amycolatopsis iheyensis TaxID=2945988 RepID=A0A9X2N8R2_9PSEU|nr:hypothetical protein [Amycolatopsis iheyensis]MCR6482983.1 hypothetical protein [Amycolatopsis iheyensis]
MTQGDAPVGRSVKTAAAGVRDLAAEAARVGAAAAARAVEITDRKLSESADELAKVGRSATKDFDKSTRSSRRDVLKHSVAARDEVLARAGKMRDPGRKAALAIAVVAGSTGESSRKRRKAVATAKRDLAVALEEAKSVARGERGRRSRWPWLLAAGVVAAAVVAVVQVRRSNPLVEQDHLEPGDKTEPPAKPVAETPAAPGKHEATKPVAKPAPPKPSPANGHAPAGHKAK